MVEHTTPTLIEKVISFLPKDKRLQLQAALAQRVSNRTLDIFTNSISLSDKLKIFKHSLISIFPKRIEDKEYSQLIHLVRVVLDSVISDEVSIVVEQSPGKTSKRTTQVVKPNEVTPSSKKAKRASEKRSEEIVDHDMVTQELTVQNQESSSMDVVLSENPSKVSEHTTALPHENSHTDRDPQGKPRRIRKRGKRSIGSATPDNPALKKFALEQLTEQESRCDATTLSDDDTYTAVWRAGSLIAHSAMKYNDKPPRYIGIECRAETVRKCSQCVETLLSYPLTPCSSVNCTDASHLNALFPHEVGEYPLQAFHDDNYDIDLLERLMLQKKLMPSLMMIMSRDRNDQSKKLRCKSKRKRLVDDIMANRC